MIFTHSMAKKLIINADDFGQSKGVNKGIIQAYEMGIVTSASLMVRYPDVLQAAEYSKNNPGLSVGLHIDLGEWIYSKEEWTPLYEVVDLNDMDAVKDEIKKQLDLFQTVTGRNPSHIDSHQHVHMRKELKPVVMNFASDLNIILRRCNDKVNYCGDFYGQDVDGSPLHEMISVDGMDKTLSSIPEGITELACHPGLNDDLQTMYRLERELEINTLCDSQIKKSLERNKIELCSFNDVTN